MFIRGIIGLCPCGAELSVRIHVVGFEQFGHGFNYHTRCQCGREDNVVVGKEQHRAAARYLRQVVVDETARDQIVEPVSPEEELLLEWRGQLQNATVELFT